MKAFVGVSSGHPHAAGAHATKTKQNQNEGLTAYGKSASCKASRRFAWKIIAVLACPCPCCTAQKVSPCWAHC